MAEAEPQEEPEPEAEEPESVLPKEPEPEAAPSSVTDVPQCPGAPLFRHHEFSRPPSESEPWRDALIQAHGTWDFLAMPEDNGTTRTPAVDEDISESMGEDQTEDVVEPSSDCDRHGGFSMPVTAAAMQDLEQDGVPCCVCGDRTWGAVDEVCPNCLPVALRYLRCRAQDLGVAGRAPCTRHFEF
jgi:hypothetical protein